MARRAATFQMTDGFSGSLAQVAEHYSVPENVIRKRMRAGATVQEAVDSILSMRERASAQQAKWRDDPVSAASSVITDMVQALTPDTVMQQMEMNLQPADSANSASSAGKPFATDLAAGGRKNGRGSGSKSPSSAKKQKKPSGATSGRVNGKTIKAGKGVTIHAKPGSSAILDTDPAHDSGKDEVRVEQDSPCAIPDITAMERQDGMPESSLASSNTPDLFTFDFMPAPSPATQDSSPVMQVPNHASAPDGSSDAPDGSNGAPDGSMGATSPATAAFSVSAADWAAMLQQMERMSSTLAALTGMMERLLHARMQVEVRLLPENGGIENTHH